MTKNEHWLYLEKLRRSGETNMWGAAPYLMREFDVDEKEATQILLNWMQHYNPNDYRPERLRVCYKRPGEAAAVREINNSIDALQGLVGGFIELAKVVSEGVGILCNEEGLMFNLPVNIYGLVGPLVWIGLSEDDFRSLTDEEVEEIMQRWG